MKGWWMMGLLAVGVGLGATMSKAQVTTAELAAAEANQLSVVPADSLPYFGTIYSWQRPFQAPAPVNFFPELPLYDLGDGRYLLDDRDLDYTLVNALAGLMAESEGGGATQNVMADGVGKGCGLRLSISRNTSSNVVLTLHNTRPNQNYVLWSLTNLALTNWVVETNVTGVSGNLTDALVAMLGRTNLFLKATESRDYQVDTSSTFDGLGLAETMRDPPDSMGAVGPDHFVELLNGEGTNAAIAVYTKSGTLVALTNTLDFFRNGTNYPTSAAMVDPRILYDHKSQRWVACAIDRDPGQVVLAVSKTPSPTNFVTGWTNYLLAVKRTGLLTDFTTLGLDDNGIYVTVVHLSSTNAGHTVMAVKKPEIYNGIFVTNRLEITTTNTPPVWTVQPAINFDDVATNDYAWFVGKGPPDLSTNYQGGAIHYRRLQWSSTNAAWAETNWITVSNTATTYRDYYDLDGTNVTVLPTQGAGINAPNLDGTPIGLHVVGSRLAMTTIRNDFLWTCQVVGLSGTNGAYVGNETGTNVNRTGVQWLKLQVDTAGGTLKYTAHGRSYDRSPTSAVYYYFPSLAVNCTGDMVVGFSGSSATNYIGAYYSWRLAGGTSLDTPRLIQAGLTNYFSPRWGDYSATTLDPTDDWSFWTVQEYAAPESNELDSYWRTIISRIKPSP